MLRNVFDNYLPFNNHGLHIALVEPQIPPNTGNIARLCAVSGTKLHLIGKLGFSILDKDLKRAGLDYWSEVFVAHYDSFDQFSQKFSPEKLHFATTSASKNYWDTTFNSGDCIVLGSETKGIPPEILALYPDRWIQVPMREGARSMNLSTCTGVILYEAFRQLHIRSEL